jgi:molybdopterin-binding protein
VAGTFGNGIGVELICGDQKLLAEVTNQAVKDLCLAAGCKVFAAIKASAFRPLGRNLYPWTCLSSGPAKIKNVVSLWKSTNSPYVFPIT